MELTDTAFYFTDTHCHLYADEFNNDRNEAFERSANASVKQFYLPAIDSHTHDAMIQVEHQFPQCKAMMGLHPCSVTENYKNELNLVEEWLNKRSFIAVGEIGLDYYWSTEYKMEQKQTFTTQMQWALERKLPIVIHSRNAMQETIDTVKPFADKGLRGIFHCFSGNAEEAKEIVEMNFYLGIGGIVTYKNSGLPEALQTISLDTIVLETDAPYLSPVPYRGKRNESSYLPFIAQKLAEVKSVSVEEVAMITTKNAEKIFSRKV